MDNKMTQQDAYIFVGSYTESERVGIQLLSFDSVQGKLIRLGGISGVKNPAFLAWDPERSRLFAVSEVEEGQVIAYSVDLHSGEIKEVNRQSTQGAAPCHLNVDPTGRWLYSVNYTGGSVCLFPIEDNGAIGPIADFIQHTGSSIQAGRQEAPHPHSIFSNTSSFSPYQFVPDLGTDQIYIYSLDASIGKLNLHATTPTTPGSGPRHLVFHPAKPYVYVIQELDSTIAFFMIDGENAKLSLQQTISTLPNDFSGENYCADIHISTSGMYLYGSNRGDDSIVTYRIIEDGKLEWVGNSTTMGLTPRNFAMLPDGEHMLVANQDSDSIIVMSLGADGVPTPTGENYKTQKPVCLKVFPNID
jgi:6-phosphogluconolactonase